MPLEQRMLVRHHCTFATGLLITVVDNKDSHRDKQTIDHAAQRRAGPSTADAADALCFT
jgi:hypothetical protein